VQECQFFEVRVATPFTTVATSDSGTLMEQLSIPNAKFQNDRILNQTPFELLENFSVFAGIRIHWNIQKNIQKICHIFENDR
jgi:hypothetical protein